MGAVTMMPYFDIQDCVDPVSWPVYCLLFAAEAWGNGNDRVYKIDLSSMDERASDEQRAWFDKEIRVHPSSRCFPGDAKSAYQEMLAQERYPTFSETVEEFNTWLKTNGLTANQTEVLVRIWW